MTGPTPPVFEHTYAAQLEGLYAPLEPAGFPAPQLVVLNEPLAAALGLDPVWLREHGAKLLAATELPPGTRPIAQAYAGHQFGHFSPQLGDGRALLLGELVDPQGRRFDLHLKGSGRTPFSRGGDGRAALDSALREYVISEAMHALGIPTTRALAVVTTGELVVRKRRMPGAVLARIAASHLRVGTLEYFAARRDRASVQRLIAYTLARHYPERGDAANPALALLEGVAQAQAGLIAQWMLVGFIHGVMNTDNSSLSGETIDYGPCAFMDAYDPATVFSEIDERGRYAYGNQPRIGQWNLARLAEALLPELDDDPDRATALAHKALEQFAEALAGAWLTGMRAKLGLTGEQPADQALAESLLEWMEQHRIDFTSAFRRLADGLRAGTVPYVQPGFAAWHARWLERLGPGDHAAVAGAMDRVNPCYIPRNHLVEQALAAAVAGDLAPFHRLLAVVTRPFDAQPGAEDYALPAPPELGPHSTHCNT
jgi:uncharacterized protein YdiU (UPF0061 family)